MNEKKMGRPTENPRTNRIELRMSDEDVQRLDFCSQKTKLSKSDVIRMGIEKVYNEIKNKK